MLIRNHRQEALCRAYVQAVAALAGVATSVPVPDYGIDLSLRRIEQHGQRYLDTRLQVDLQLRSTTRAIASDQDVSYDLDVDTYNFLREVSLIRCLLVLLVLPDEEGQWLTQTPEELLIRRCAYWVSLRQALPTRSVASIRIRIPRRQVFSPLAIGEILQRLSRGEEP